MTERDLAEKVCNECAKAIVDEQGGISMGGISLAEAYAKREYRKGSYDVMQIGLVSQALRHWVSAVGYADNGEFQIVMSNYIQNC